MVMRMLFSHNYKYWGILLLSFILIQYTHASDYGGCGGTVTVAPELSRLSKTKVDFTVVKVKLVSRDGVLKYSTECAPTGHFFVPTYDKGSFFLDIEGPAGWNFEPSRVPVTISEDSQCGNNINFKFTGFSLKGKVIGSGASSKEGPKGVTLTLYVEGNKVGTAVTGDTGAYVFHNVYPGDYEISASHPRWQISPSKIKTHMEWNNLEVETPFVVAGFSVTGTVLSGDEAVPGVDFYLYSETVHTAGCTAPSGSADKSKGKGKLLCVAKSNSNGEFQFSSVPSGDYTLVPVYSSAHTTFDVAPSVASIRVGNDDTAVATPFRVVGFGVTGKVVAGGKGIEGARVLVNGVEKAVTGKDGLYSLEQFKSGSYEITAQKENYVFSVLKAERVTGNNPRISDIQATEVSVCGVLSIAHPPPNVKLGLRDVQIKGEGATKFRPQTVQADKNGKYCVSLPAGSYTITPVVSSTEEKSGLNFSPSQATIEVAATPLNDINFSQLRVTVSGRVVCLTSPCDSAVSVTLHPSSSASSSSSITTGLGLDNQFVLRDVLPGSYRVSVNIPNDVWCWDSQSRELSIARDTANIEFVQTGYVLPVTASHDAELHIARAKESQETHSVSAGVPAKICLKKPGTYTITPKSCFKFGQDAFTFDTASPRALELKASQFLVKGTVNAVKVSVVEIAVADQSQEAVVATVPAHAQKGTNTFSFEYWATPGANLKFSPSTPKNASLLSYPPAREFTVPATATTCLTPLSPFEVRKGLFLNGKVLPGIAGVRIVVKGPSDEELAQVLTSSDGTYSVGPLYEGEHTVYAQKEDFHFQRDETGLVFRAAKLGRARVEAVDAKSGEVIPGVLLSLSGEGYHNNTAIPASGTLVFTDLFPGSYFLRAHLKEYSFQPAHASVTVEEGKEATHKFLVTRVAFSCFGSVKGLNSLPERGVVVLAQPKNSSTASLEETQTDNTGNFRLRGLHPSVSYSIFVKNSLSNSANADSLRSSTGDLAIPESFDIVVGKEDIHNTDFVVIRKPVYFDIVGCVNASAEHLSTLTANLYDSRSSDNSPIKTIPLGVSKTFIFNDLSAKSDSEYTVRLTTSLSSRSYQISISPDVTVQPKQVAGPRTACLPFSFEASLKNDITEVPVQGLSSFIILLVLPAIAFKYRVKLTPIAKDIYAQYLALRARRAGLPAPKRASSFKKSGKESSQNDFDFLPPGLGNFSGKSKQKTKTK